MRKLLLLAVGVGLGITSFAQRSANFTATKKVAVTNLPSLKTNGAARTTAVGDTMIFGHIYSTDTQALYRAPGDSGFCAGMDFWEDKGFAERFKVVGTDSTIQVLGMITKFGGTVAPGSSKNVTLKIWNSAGKTSVTPPKLFHSGYPTTVVTSATVGITHLGIATVDTAVDTAKVFLFATPTGYLTSDFFAGYDMTYTWAGAAGDTIGLYSNKDGERHGGGYSVSGTDTIINFQNVTQYKDGSWVDNYFGNFSLYYNLYVFPIVKIGNRSNLSTASISRNGLTFYGNYPNPAANSTNVRFALAKSTSVTIEVMDITGRKLSSVTHSSLVAGEHNIALETAELAAGQYIYVIRTNEGEGMASQLTIAK